MEYVFAKYQGAEYFYTVKILAEILIYLYLFILIGIIIKYNLTKDKYKRDCAIFSNSIYCLLPLVYSLIFITFRIYISLPLITVSHIIISFAEASEINTVKKKYHITVNIKKTNKYIIILSSFAIIIILMSVLYFKGIYYLF